MMQSLGAAALLAVFVGGGAGALARFVLARWALAAQRDLIWATLGANVLACLVLGYLTFGAGREIDSPTARLLLATGFCGGFSTFSTFGLEVVFLLEAGRPTAALGYVAASLVLGVAALAVWKLV